MRVVVRPGGEAVYLYSEEADLTALGRRAAIRRASNVEFLPWADAPFTGAGWYADLKPSGGPVLGPFAHRSQALAAEERWLLDNVLRKAVAK